MLIKWTLGLLKFPSFFKGTKERKIEKTKEPNQKRRRERETGQEAYLLLGVEQNERGQCSKCFGGEIDHAGSKK